MDRNRRKIQKGKKTQEKVSVKEAAAALANAVRNMGIGFNLFALKTALIGIDARALELLISSSNSGLDRSRGLLLLEIERNYIIKRYYLRQLIDRLAR